MKKQFSIFIYHLFFLAFVSKAPNSLGQIPENAKTAFDSKNYDRTIQHLRQYLRQRPYDFENWSFLGVVYFHTGQPRKALKYLKYSESKTRDRATNHFYQGLSYLSLKNTAFAKRYFEKLSLSQNQWSEAALLELILLEYKNRNTEQARLQIANYKLRYPRGALLKKVVLAESQLESGEYNDKLEGFPKPDTTRALFRYSPLSLTETPHFWYLGLAGTVEDKTNFVPDQKIGLKPNADQNTQLIFRSSIGLGPIKQSSSTFLSGYTYNQSWVTTPERVDTFLNDPSDFAWQPFRPDLLERDHQFFLDLKSQLSKQFFSGLYASRNYSRVGSMIQGPEKAGVEENLPMSDQTTVIPWIGANLDENWKIIAYWYFEKKLNLETPEFSYQTYSFNNSNIPVSIGIDTNVDFPSIKAHLKLQTFHFELFYNDPFLDYSRNGALLAFAHSLFPTFNLEISAGLYRDAYAEYSPRNQACNSTSESQATNATPTFCNRLDAGTMYTGEVSWNYTQFNRVYAGIQKISNQNSGQKVYQFEKISYTAGVSLAFPAIDKVLKYTEKMTEIGLDRSIK